MYVCGNKDNSLRERFLQKCNLTLFKAISAVNAFEETRKHTHKILRSQPTAHIDFKKKLSKSSHSICYQNTKDLNVNLMIIHIPEANVQLIEKFVMFAIKKTISKFAAQVFVKKST